MHNKHLILTTNTYHQFVNERHSCKHSIDVKSVYAKSSLVVARQTHMEQMGTKNRSSQMANPVLFASLLVVTKGGFGGTFTHSAMLPLK